MRLNIIECRTSYSLNHQNIFRVNVYSENCYHTCIQNPFSLCIFNYICIYFYDEHS